MLRRAAPVGWRLDERVEGAWSPMYTVVDEPVHPADVVVSNHYTSTWPESPFRHRPVVVRKTDRAVRRLLGRQLSVTRADGTVDAHDLTDEQFAATLRDLGLHLPEPDVRRLFATT